ncbi:ABC transporter permease [Cohnella cellulosilytica]|uniref:ABC transporter permease n=1 Tax=Cohnella cellulosilytica TaxID=986710 RepID=A0ABW2FCS2_9BACL
METASITGAVSFCAPEYERGGLPVRSDAYKSDKSYKFTLFKTAFLRSIRQFGIAAAFPLCILAAWQLLSQYGVISVLLFPPPLDIVEVGAKLIANGVLLPHLQISVTRCVLGFLLGGSLGIATGLLVGLFRQTEKTLNPTLQMLRMIPTLAITPLFVLWFGFEETAKILLIATSAFFPLYLNVFLGVRSLDNRLFEVSRVLEYSWLQRVFTVILPAASPHILMGLRLSLGVSWLSLIVAELIGPTSGIGYLMMDARLFSDTPIVFVGIIVFALVGKMTDSLVRWLERKTLKWRDNYQG